MRVMVTGALGFIGINVVKCLAQEGDTIVALYRTPPDKASLDFLKSIESQVSLVKGDVEDSKDIARLVREHKIEGIIHAAAMTPLLETELAIPDKIMRINFMGTMHVLEAARLNGVQRVIYVSSDAVYGNMLDPNKIRAEDDVETFPGNLYGIAKIASEGLCRRYQSLFDLEIASGRVCATYGPMERETRSRKGMSPVYQIARAILENQALSVHGAQVVRTWTHVLDIAGGIVAMLKTPSLSYPAYNLSYGPTYSLRQVLTAFQKVEPSFQFCEVSDGEKADISCDASRNRGPLDIQRLRNDVGFEPKYDIESGVRAYMDWYRSSDRTILV